MALLSQVPVASAQEDPVPRLTSFEVSPNPVQLPGGYSVTATVDTPPYWTAYEVVIINEDTGAEVTCRSNYHECGAGFYVGWERNESLEPIRYHAEVRHRDSGNVVERSEQRVVNFERFDFEITSFEVSPNPVQLPGWYSVTATVNERPYGTGYEVVIVDDDSGAETVCRSNSYDCSAGHYVGWERNESLEPFRYHAEVRHTDSGRVVDRTEQLTVGVDGQHFDVTLGFSPPTVGGDGVRRWDATATSNPTVSGTPYALKIQALDETVVASCSYSSPCATNLGPGTYRATVEDVEGHSFGRSSWWTLDEEGARDQTVDDVDLISLAALFASPSAVCDYLLTGGPRQRPWAGTHGMSPPSTLSDQYRACQAAVQAGKGTIAVLAAIAAAHEGTTVLSWLRDEATEEQTPDDPDEEPDPTPIPAPPVFWPNQFEADVDQLMAQNPNLTDRRVARTVLRQCYRYVSRTTLGEMECLRLPIFASGDLDVPEPTAHDRASILKRPQWVSLNYQDRSDGSGRGWYASDPTCAGSSETIHCHEYPFFSTQQGGGDAVPRPRLKLVSGFQNRSQGGKLLAFYRRCGLRVTGSRFLSTPAPSGSNVPTLPLCNGNG